MRSEVFLGVYWFKKLILKEPLRSQVGPLEALKEYCMPNPNGKSLETRQKLIEIFDKKIDLKHFSRRLISLFSVNAFSLMEVRSFAVIA